MKTKRKSKTRSRRKKREIVCYVTSYKSSPYSRTFHVECFIETGKKRVFALHGYTSLVKKGRGKYIEPITWNIRDDLAKYLKTDILNLEDKLKEIIENEYWENKVNYREIPPPATKDNVKVTLKGYAETLVRKLLEKK